MITEYHFDKLNVGGSLECLLHSFINDEQVLLINPLYPFQLETMGYVDNLKFIGYESTRDIYKSEVWDRLSFLLSMSGQVVFPNIVKTYREDVRRFILVTEFNKRIIITCDELCRFEEMDDRCYSVYDWFNVRSGNNHQYDILKDNRNDFVHTLHFYRANRIGSNGAMKDVCAASRLDKEHLSDANHTEGIAHLKTLKMMAKAGIRGQSNGYSKIGTQLHYALKIEHTHREVVEDYTPHRTLDEILQDRRKEGKAWNLAKRLFRHKQISILQGSFRLPANL
tara:strand:+ start:10729 stop:11571 length:843 start_codon:yes stop_codon:yes gene_type:complete